MNAYYSDCFVLPLPAGHRFPMAKYRMLREAAAAQLPSLQFHQAPTTTDGVLALARRGQMAMSAGYRPAHILLDLERAALREQNRAAAMRPDMGGAA